jgi:hypothetical protein
MTTEEVIAQIKVGDYGELCYRDRFGYGKLIVGKVKFVTGDGDVMFYANDYKDKRLHPPEKIVSFTPLEMLPAPTEYKGKPVFFKDGVWVDKRGKEIDFKRNSF